jgi:hypothetical protein
VTDSDEIREAAAAGIVVDERTETPMVARARCVSIGAQLTAAERQLKAARDAEVRAHHDHRSARRRLQLSDSRPKVERGGATVAEQQAWVDSQVEQLELAADLAEAARIAAKDHHSTLETQAMLAQSLLKSIDRAFAAGHQDNY